MTVDDGPTARTLDTLASLPTYDVSERHARRLRRRCHARLQTQARADAPDASERAPVFRRIVGPALGGAWCLAYLVEMVRRVVEVYVR